MLRRGFTLNRYSDTYSCLHALRSWKLYSTSVASKDGITNPLMVNFLVKSLGFSEEEAVSIVSKTEVSRRFKSTEKSESVVRFLKSSGFDDTHIRKVVINRPSFLHCDVERTLKPKLSFFQKLGFSGSDLGLVISQHPIVLGQSLNSHIVPALQLLKSIIGNDEQLVSLLLNTKSPLLLSSNVLKYLPANVLLLQSYGVPTEKIKRCIQRRPFLMLQTTQWFEKVVKGVEEKLGIPRTSGMFLHGVIALGMKSDEKFKSWLQVFRSYGWSETEILTLLRSQPSSLNLHEKEVGVRLKYFIDELGYGSDYLASRGALLSHSMDKRIVPRIAVVKALKENQMLNYNGSFYTLLRMSECKFVNKYVLPCKDKLPRLYEYYTEKTSGSISKT